MKFTKLLIFLAFLSLHVLIANAGSGSGSVVVTVKVNGACSSPQVHYSCSSGTSTNNLDNFSSYTWSCSGLNGGTTVGCLENKVTYTVTGVAGANGTISPSSRTGIVSGAVTTFNVTPNASYTASASGCGGSLSGTTYTTGPITSNCTVTASFVNNTPLSTPTGFSATASTCGVRTLNLTWNAVSGATSYDLYRVGVSSPIYSGSSLSFSDTGLNLGQSYTYNLYAKGSRPTSSAATTSGTVANSCVMTGTITPPTPTCVILSGASTCQITLTWATTNPVSTSAVTSAGVTVASGNNGTQSFMMGYGSKSYYLYNNAVLLDQSDATSSCASGNGWNGTICTPTIIGTCSSPQIHYSCSTGTSTNNVNGATSYTWTCSGAGGGANANCSENKAAVINGACSSPQLHYSCNAGTSANNVNGATSYTWTCNGAGGGTTANCTENKAAVVNGVCSATHYNCTAGTSANNVNGATSYTWSCTGSNGGTTANCTENKVAVVNGSCSTAHYNCNAGTSANNVNGATSYTWNCNGTGGGTTASCVENKVAVVNGICSATHYNCNAGSSSSNTSGATNWTWNCDGSGGGTTANCSENKPAMSGTINPPTPSCVISDGSSSCSVTLTWSTTNPVGTSAVTASGMTNVNGNSGSQSFTVPYSSRIFYLYNNAVLLDQSNATSSCAGGTAWDAGSNTCKTTSVMTGTLSATDCTIAEGDSDCSTNLSWQTYNPVGTSAVTTPSSVTVKTANTSTATYVVSTGPGNRNFYLYNNGILLAQDTADSSCASGTTWDGIECAVTIVPVDGGWDNGTCGQCDATCNQQCTKLCNNPAPQNGGANCPGDTTGTGIWNYTQSCSGGLCVPPAGSLNINFTATPDKIFKGRSSVLTWTSDADSCVGDGNFSTGPGNPANGSVTVYPLATTTYTITCTAGITENKDAKVKVSSLTVIEI